MKFLIGLLAGITGGITGGGGGIVMIPLLVGILQLDQHTAHGMSLVALVFTGLAGAITYAVNGSVDVTASLLMASIAVAAAHSGARFAHALPGWKLKRSFGGYLIVVAVLLLLKPYLTALPSPGGGMMKITVLLLTGGLAGFTSGMMGVGGGAIMIPAMVLLAGFDQHVAQGTSLLVMVPTGSAGAYTHWRLGNVRTTQLRGLVPGVLVGSFLGSTAAHSLSDSSLRMIFAAVLIWTGMRFLRTKRPAFS
jgi:uncharacterized membrane protein YfcA